MILRFFLYLIYFLSPLVSIIIIYNSNISKYGNPLMGITMIFAVCAYVWFGFEFVLSSRPKFIEKHFGLDKMYRFHSLMAVISLILAFIHSQLVEFIVEEGLIGQIGEISLIMFGAIGGLALVFLIDSILLKIKPLAYLKKFSDKYIFFKYEKQVLLHNLTAIAYTILFIHVLLSPPVKDNRFVITIFTVYYLIGISFYGYHKLIKKSKLERNIFIVDEVIKESNAMYTLKLVPEDGHLFNYNPGQFGFLKLLSEIGVEEHPFSISSDPLNDDYISFTIKELGDFTSKIKDVKPGEKAMIDAPYGRFSYVNFPDEKNIVLISGGVGITPALSMLRYIRKNDKNKNIILIWGVKNPEELICIDELNGILNEMKNFYFVPVMSNSNSWEGEKGRIDNEKIRRILELYGFDISSSGFYVCGPPLMAKSVIIGLKNMDVNKKRIHFEKFAM